MGSLQPPQYRSAIVIDKLPKKAHKQPTTKFGRMARAAPPFLAGLGVRLDVLLLAALIILSGGQRTFAQGCIPARHIALSLDAEGISYLEPNHWDISVSYRYLHSENTFIGYDEQPQYKAGGSNNVTTVHSFDVGLTYALSRRFSASLVLPFLDGEGTNMHADKQRHTMHAGGFGDLRFLGNAWVWDPAKDPKGNALLSLGFKAPTGDYRATDQFYRATGPVRRPVDISIQPGDGGWGIVPEVQAYRQLFENAYAYLAGFYLINPRVKNGTETLRSIPGNVVINSVPDQYQGRVGLSYVVWPKQGVALSLGTRIDGIPVRDLIGGGDDGFRRPGFSIYFEPGLTISHRKYTFTLSGPVALVRNMERSIRDLETGTRSPGGFADFLIVASLSRRF